MRFCDGCGTLQPQLQIPHEIHSLTNLIWRHPVLISVIVLFVVTALTIFPLFMGDSIYDPYGNSAPYISDSVFISNNFPNVGWFPFWYGGLPFYLSYPPLFIYSVSFLHALSGLSIIRSYRVIAAISYSVTPAAVYLIARFLTKRNMPSFFAALAYSFVPTFLPPPVPSHIEGITYLGEAPHYFGLALGLFAVLALLYCSNKASWFRCLTASILIASVALANLVAFFTLAFLILISAAIEAIYRNDTAILAYILSCTIGFGFIAFQYDLKFLTYNTFYSPATTSGLAHAALLFPLMLVGIFLFRRYFYRFLVSRANSKAWAFVILWIAGFGAMVGGATWFNVQLAPQASRYSHELDAGVGLLIGLILTKVDRVSLDWRAAAGVRIPYGRKVWAATALLVLMIINVLFLVPLTLTYTLPTPAVYNLPEYEVAKWLSGHVTDQRAFATGALAFWLAAFSNVAQIRGVSDHGATNTWWAAVSYQILTGQDPGTSVLWAEAWNVKYIVVSFPNVSVYGGDYLFPHKFDNILALRFYTSGYGVFEVPLNDSSFIETVSMQAAESLPTIQDVSDIRALAAYDYLTQVNSGSSTRMTYTSPNPDLFQVNVAGATVDTAVIVKTTFDLGWVAQVNGEAVQTLSIGPDFIIAYPRMSGDYQLTFSFQPSVGETVGFYATVATMIALLAISIDRLRRGKQVRKRGLSTVRGEGVENGITLASRGFMVLKD